MSTAHWPDIVVGAGALVVVVLILVGALLLFERRFLPRGPVHISFAGGIPTGFDVPAGGNLLTTLSQHGLLLPSACGGGGTCGLCRIRVTRGGGDVLPTELIHLGRRDAISGWRLACQVRVRADVEVALPAALAAARAQTCEVVAARDVATFIREIVLSVPGGEPLRFEAGEFVQLHIPAYRDLRFSTFDIDDRYRDDWRQMGLFGLVADNDRPTERAYSLANPPEQSDRLVVNVRIATPPPGSRGIPPGVGSSYLYSLRPGDRVQLAGPFGEFHIADSDREMVYIGGGAGMAPLRSHILHLFGPLRTKRAVSYWYGARSVRELLYAADFEQLAANNDNFSFHVALSEPLVDDRWPGETGCIHQVVRERYLEDHPDLDNVEFYVCGPPAMLRATRAMLDELGVDASRIAFDDFGG